MLALVFFVTVVTFFRTLAPLALVGMLRFRQQCLAREFQLAGLGIHADQFHLDHVTLLEAGLLHRLKPLVVDLGDVQQGTTANATVLRPGPFRAYE